MPSFTLCSMTARRRARHSRSLAELSVRQMESLIASLKRQGVDEILLLTLAELLP